MAVAGGPRLAAVFFDFDSTISMPYIVERLGDWAVADRQVFVTMLRANLSPF